MRACGVFMKTRQRTPHVMLNLSYTLSASTSFYSGLAKLSIERVYYLSRGDACNSFYFRASNH